MSTQLNNDDVLSWQTAETSFNTNTMLPHHSFSNKMLIFQQSTYIYNYLLLLWVTVFSLSLITTMFHLLLSYTGILMLTALLILLTACLPSYLSLAAQDILLFLTPVLSTSLKQELTSILCHSFLFLDCVHYCDLGGPDKPSYLSRSTEWFWTPPGIL